MSSGYLSFNDLEELARQDQPISFDYENILLECKKSLQTAINSEVNLPDIEVESLPKSDPLIKLLETLAYRELLIRQRIKEGILASRVASAQKDDLQRLTGLLLEDPTEVPGNLQQEIIEQQKNIYTAGTIGGYKHFTRESLTPKENEDLVDMKVDSPDRGIVQIVLLFARRLYIKKSGQTDTELLETRQRYMDKIKERLLNKEIRPIGHKIEIKEVKPKSYRIKARLGVQNLPGAAEVRNAAENEVKGYIRQRYRFGTTVYRTGVLSALQQAGVNYIILEDLNEDPLQIDVEVDPVSVPLCETIEVELDTKVPDQLVQSAFLKQVEVSEKGILSCGLLISPPAIEIRITHYIVYWGSAVGKKISGLSPLAIISVGGDKLIKIVDISIPEKAFTFVIHTANQNGEMDQGFAIRFSSIKEGDKPL